MSSVTNRVAWRLPPMRWRRRCATRASGPSAGTRPLVSRTSSTGWVKGWPSGSSPGAGGEQMMLQMAYFDRARRPVIMDVGPVLDLEDVVGGKVCALASRAEPRDYVDTAAALGRYSIEQMIGFARRLDPGLTDRDFADGGAAAGPVGRRGVRPFRAWPAGHRRAAGAVRGLAPDLISGGLVAHAQPELLPGHDCRTGTIAYLTVAYSPGRAHA